MSRWGVIFSKRGDKVPARGRGAQVWLEGRVFKTVGAQRARDTVQVRDSMLTGQRNATTGSRGASVNRWVPHRPRSAVFFFFSKRDDTRHTQERHQPGSSAALTKLGRQPDLRGAFTNLQGACRARGILQVGDSML